MHVDMSRLGALIPSQNLGEAVAPAEVQGQDFHG